MNQADLSNTTLHDRPDHPVVADPVRAAATDRLSGMDDQAHRRGRDDAANGGSLYGRAWGWSGANDKHR